MADRDDALDLVDTFESSGRTGIWTNIRKDDIVKGLRIRISSPDKINQAGSLLCGPAAFTYELATDDPVNYTKAVIDLFTTGTAVIGTMLLKPSKDLIYNPFTGGIHPSDWVILASLRDSSNAFFDIENVDDMAGAATIPSTMASWLRNVGFTKIVNDTNLFFSKGLSNVNNANSYLNDSYRVFLFINSAMLTTAKQENGSLAPDHWVMLLTPVEVDGAGFERTVSFKAYSWGEDKNVPEKATKPLKVSDMLANYYGYIAFKH